MSNQQDLLIITASSGENLKLAQRFFEVAEKKDINSDIVDLTTIDLPIYNPRKVELGNSAISLEKLSKQMHNSRVWVFCAPEYNGSIPPLLSNAIAWLSVQDSDFRKLFNGRRVAIASHSGGGCMELMISLRIQLSHLGSEVIGRQLTSNKNKMPTDDTIEDIISRLLQY